jgi:serine/threonine protein kinase
MSDQIGLPKGSILHGYRIGEVLRSSGFDIYYLASDVALDRTVGIREYCPQYAKRVEHTQEILPGDDPDLFRWGLNRFQQVARWRVKLSHPNLLKALTFFEANCTGYIVEELPGGTLLDQVLRSSLLSQREIDELLPGVIGGLAAMHEAGLLHRDLKPSSILLRSDDGQPLITNFFSSTSARFEEHDAIVSTGYSPPEQYRSVARQGPWTDIYALGAMLYRIISGEAPIESTLRAKANESGDRDPLKPFPQLALENYSPQLLETVGAALSLDETPRPQSVTDFFSRCYPSRDATSYSKCDIFISYAREDCDLVRILADALTEAGYLVWWDSALEGGEFFRQRIQNNLTRARCVIVVWTGRSVNSAWVCAEADVAFREKKLLPVKLEECETPLPFNTLHEIVFKASAEISDPLANSRLTQSIDKILGRGTPKSTNVKLSGAIKRATQAAIHDENNWPPNVIPLVRERSRRPPDKE